MVEIVENEIGAVEARVQQVHQQFAADQEANRLAGLIDNMQQREEADEAAKELLNKLRSWRRPRLQVGCGVRRRVNVRLSLSS